MTGNAAKEEPLGVMRNDVQFLSYIPFLSLESLYNKRESATAGFRRGLPLSPGCAQNGTRRRRREQETENRILSSWLIVEWLWLRPRLPYTAKNKLISADVISGLVSMTERK